MPGFHRADQPRAAPSVGRSNLCSSPGGRPLHKARRGLVVVATSRHGTGDAQALYRGLEAWAATNDAAWLRLGVVQGNARAERFWEVLGFVQSRIRGGVEMGRLTNTLRVMFKPLAGGTREDYLSLLPRDRPDPANAL